MGLGMGGLTVDTSKFYTETAAGKVAKWYAAL